MALQNLWDRPCRNSERERDEERKEGREREGGRNGGRKGVSELWDSIAFGTMGTLLKSLNSLLQEKGRNDRKKSPTYLQTKHNYRM